MKFRTDFVTNSSSTSYITITVDFANGQSTGIQLDDYDGVDCENLYSAAAFLKDISSAEKLAAYLVNAYDAEAQDIQVDERPAEGDYYIPMSPHNPSYGKFFIPAKRSGAHLVPFIARLAIQYPSNAKERNEKEAFITACRNNAKTITDITCIQITERKSFWQFSDAWMLGEARERIAKEIGMDIPAQPYNDAYIEALRECDPVSLTTAYRYHLADDRYETKTDIQIDDIPLIQVDATQRFFSIFNRYTGAYFRSNIYRADGTDTGLDPFMASFPHLIDVGIMGHCAHGKSGRCPVGCYQRGNELNQPHMTLADFSEIVRQCAGKVGQFALGGRGDPDRHPYFKDILTICRENGIVPNFTTSGYGLTPHTAALCRACGAVAVSWYKGDYTQEAIQMLLDEGVKTNIHYVLNAQSIDEALARLTDNDFPSGINAVIFLLHKPIGAGRPTEVLRPDDPRVKQFFALMEKSPIKIGIDSCTVPGVVNHCTHVLQNTIDTCEGSRFSCYIDANMQMMPCSFDQSQQFAVSLRTQSIEQAWQSTAFSAFRAHLQNACPACHDRAVCMGGCPLCAEIVLCDRPQRSTPPL